MTKGKSAQEICTTGVKGLDDILMGGLPRNRMYLLEGEPGTGKTTIALQFLLEGVKRRETCLYITFSETRAELEATAASHDWSLEGLDIFDVSAIEHKLRPDAQTTIFHPSEVELNETTEVIKSEVERLKPSRIVFDSASEMRLMAESSLRYRRQLLALKQYFAGMQVTVLFLDDLTAPGEEFQIQSIVHGVLALKKLMPVFGRDRRRIRVEKLRGVPFREGNHDCMIRTGGIVVFPRISAMGEGIPFERGSISSGMPGLDRLLGGGLDRGTSTLLLGPAGTGKSTLTLQYANAEAERGEAVALFSFEESTEAIVARARSFGLDLAKHIASGLLTIRKVNPAEVSPGEFASLVAEHAEGRDVKMVVIDSLSGYMHAMPEENFLVLQLHELLSYLNQRGIVTILVLAQQGLTGNMVANVDLTYLADAVIVTRFFELLGEVRKAVSVIKKRTGPHEKSIRELSIDSHGLRVGEPLNRFQGVLTGVPRFGGAAVSLLKKRGAGKGRKAGGKARGGASERVHG